MTKPGNPWLFLFNILFMKPFIYSGLFVGFTFLLRQIKINNIIKTGISYIGTPYLWGGCTPGGFDCSGFIQYIYAENNLRIPRTTNQMLTDLKSVNNLIKGDIILFNMQNGFQHAGLYIGNDEFIHASSSQGITISSLSSYWKPFIVDYKRVF